MEKINISIFDFFCDFFELCFFEIERNVTMFLLDGRIRKRYTLKVIVLLNCDIKYFMFNFIKFNNYGG